MSPSRAQFRQQLSDAFTLAELEVLCADLGVDAELIGGQDRGKAWWIDNLILYFEQADRVADLLAALRERRPRASWEYAPDDFDRVQKIIGDVVTIRGNVRDVRVEKSVLRIGTLVVPALPALIGLLVALGLSAAIAYLALIPARMPEGVNKFNVAIAEFATLDAAGQVAASTDGAWLSQDVYTSLAGQLSELQRQAGRDFQITIWHDSDWLAKRTPIGLIRDASEAAALADAIGAHVVIYGILEGGAYAPRFYMKPAQGAWDDVAGAHDFGQAMPVRGSPKDDFAFLRALAARQRQLALFTVGLMYDAFGYNADALKSLDQAVGEGDGTAVTDVLQYFIGREYSAQGRLDEAERAFSASLAANPRYARAWTGIGSVNMLRAEAREPADRQSHPELLARAREAYARALALAEADGPPIQPIAWVGLGYVARIEGDTLLQIGDLNLRAGRPAEAELNAAVARFDEAMGHLGAALPDLQRQKLIRLEAQTWLGLGAAHEQTATARRLLGQAEAASLARASDAYSACARLVSRAPNDRFLRENTAALCVRFRDRVHSQITSS